MQPVIRLDKEKLEEISKVSFTFEEIAEFIELLTIYAQRFTNPPPQDLSLSLEIAHHQDTPAPQKQEEIARRAIVEAVDQIWRERGGKTHGSYYSAASHGYKGPLVELIEHLFTAIDVVTERSTLHHDIIFVHTGTERNRSR